MKNLNKCHKCGLVNLSGDLACRRCGGILGSPSRKSISSTKRKPPRFMALAPFLLLGVGLWFWSAQIKKSALDSLNVDKAEWHELTMDSKASHKGSQPSPSPYNPFADPKVREANEKIIKDVSEYQKNAREQIEKIKVPPAQ